MGVQNWRTAYASVVGSSHKKTGAPCQDASSCQVIELADGSEVLLVVACDGAGSAARSDVGSSLVVNDFMREFGDAARQEKGLNIIDENYVLDWLKRLHDLVAKQAETEQLPIREFACTLLGAVIGVESAVFFQIGDGAITVLEEGSDKYHPIFWPQHGEFINQTNFLFQADIEETLAFIRENQKFSEIAVFTDGLERLILNFASQEVHSPALRPIFEWLAKRPGVCHEEDPSQELKAYLSSDFVSIRTDDDTTLIMATRASMEEAPCSNSL